MIRSMFLALILAATPACVEQIAESRVKAALTQAGVSERDSACMARRMVDRLTIAQLRKLEALSGTNRATLQSMSLSDYAALVRRIDDREVVAVTTTSAALCATGLGG